MTIGQKPQSETKEWGAMDDDDIQVDPEERPPPALKFPSYALWSSNSNMEDAILALSVKAYDVFLRAIEHSLTKGVQTCVVDDPKMYYWGKFAFHYQTFIHGVKRKVDANTYKRDRSIWMKQKQFTPFEHLRRTLAKNGIYVVYRYKNLDEVSDGESRAQVLVLSKFDIERNENITHHEFKGKVVRVWGTEIQWHTLNVIPH